ncbi:hypothetical protein Nepgr_012346 [Nepenthes gracilis]|uniref:Uncharacterized protein n=1 Tax=Nepenthes gracilis TaxID=150966 RepID=A0AAD3SFK1_NEPGR|nr:hypothetical protein Nepgr_012346 [Nepenthes gracilis]
MFSNLDVAISVHLLNMFASSPFPSTDTGDLESYFCCTDADVVEVTHAHLPLAMPEATVSGGAAATADQDHLRRGSEPLSMWTAQVVLAIAGAQSGTRPLLLCHPEAGSTTCHQMGEAHTGVNLSPRDDRQVNGSVTCAVECCSKSLLHSPYLDFPGPVRALSPAVDADFPSDSGVAS